MRSSDLELVRGLPLFLGMAPENFDGLVGAALLQKFPPHVTLDLSPEISSKNG